MIIFRTESNLIDTSELSKWAHLQPELWNKFQNGDQKALDDLSMYVDENDRVLFDTAFKEYRTKLSRNGNPYPFWSARKEARTL